MIGIGVLFVFLCIAAECTGNYVNGLNSDLGLEGSSRSSSNILPFLPSFPNRRQGRSLRPDEVQGFLEQQRTREFLAKFNNSIQREMVVDHLRHCPYNSLCGFSLNLKFKLEGFKPCCRECACDYPECIRNMSCCPDIIPLHVFSPFDIYTNGSESFDYSFNTSDVVSNNSYSDRSPREIVDEKLESEFPGFEKCTLLHAKRDTTGRWEQDSAYTIASCPVSTDNLLKSRCEQRYSMDNIEELDDMIPWMDEQHVYRNKYCALCNDVVDGLVRWQVYVRYSPFDNSARVYHGFVERIFEDNDVDVRFFSDFGMSNEKWCTTVVSECNITGEWLDYDPIVEGKCAVTSTLIEDYSSSVLYQNTFCMQCNAIETPESVCTRGQGSPADAYPFSGLLAVDLFTEERATLDDWFDELHCKEPNQLFDYISGECVSPTCSAFHTSSNGTCERLFSMTYTVVYGVRFRLVPSSELNLETIFDNVYVLEDALFNLIFMNFNGRVDSVCRVCSMNLYFTLFEDILETLDVQQATVRHLDVLLKVSVSGFHVPYHVGEIFTSLSGTVFSLDYVNTQFLVIMFDDMSPKFQNLNEVTDDRETVTTTANGENKGLALGDLVVYAKYDSLQQIMLPYPEKVFNANCAHANNYISALSIRDCPVISARKEDLSWTEERDGMFIPDFNFRIDRTDFYHFNSTMIYVCKNAYSGLLKLAEKRVRDMLEDNKARSSSDLVENVLSIVFTSLSIICLLVTSIMFTALSQLRTLPGLNTLTLSVNLMISQSLYLLSSFGGFEKGSTVCIVIGVLLHFFSLLSVFWMNVCTFHMFRSLTSTKVMSKKFGRKYILFHLYAILLSSIFVVTCLVTSRLLSNGNDLGYGKVTCYVSSGILLRYTFALPVFIVVVLNSVMFTIVIARFSSQHKYIKKNLRTERNDFFIFIKLSTLTGFTWIFGLLFSVLGIKVFSYLFIVLNASQGIFISVSFAFNPRVLKLCANKLGLFERTDSQTPQTRSTNGGTNTSNH